MAWTITVGDVRIKYDSIVVKVDITHDDPYITFSREFTYCQPSKVTLEDIFQEVERGLKDFPNLELCQMAETFKKEISNTYDMKTKELIPKPVPVEIITAIEEPIEEPK